MPVSRVDSAEHIPLLQDQKPVDPASNDEEVGRSSGQSRSAAEDLVARRLRVLNKKLHRFRSYVGGPGLNADQRAGIASIPGLEAATKELEDLGVSLEYLATCEEKREHALRLEQEATTRRKVAAAVDEYKAECLPLLSSLLTVHGILHPAGVVETHFMANELPEFLQGLTRDDVFLVDNLHKDLVAGAIENTLDRIRNLDADSNVSRALDSLAKLPQPDVHSPYTRSPSEQDDYPLSSADAKGSVDTAKLGATVPGEVEAPEIGVHPTNLTPGDSSSHGLKAQQKVFSFIQSSELSPLEGAEGGVSPKNWQPESEVGLSKSTEESLNDREVKSSRVGIDPLTHLDFGSPGVDAQKSDTLQSETTRMEADLPTDTGRALPESPRGVENPPVLSGTQIQEDLSNDDSHQNSHDISAVPKSLPGAPTATIQVAETGPTQQRRKPSHRPKSSFRVDRTARNGQFNSATPLSSIDQDGFQVATRRRGQGNNSGVGSLAQQGGVGRNQGNKVKGAIDRHQGKGAATKLRSVEVTQ